MTAPGQKRRSTFNSALVTNDDLSPWCLECGAPTPAGRERTCSDRCAMTRLARISGATDWLNRRVDQQAIREQAA